MNSYIHSSKLTATRVAAELTAIGWLVEVVQVGAQFEVRYRVDPSTFFGPDRRATQGT